MTFRSHAATSTTRRSLLLTLAATMVWLGLSLPAFAQGGTTVQFYLVPKIGTGVGQDDFRAKYLNDSLDDYPNGGGTGKIAGMAFAMDYGLESILLVGANVTPAEDTAISAQPDVIKVPAGLDTSPSSLNLSALQTKLEALRIPANHLTTAVTYRQILRHAARLFLIFQRYHFVSSQLITASGQSLFTSGITLDSNISQLSQAQRSALNQTATDLGLSTAGITNGTSIRAALLLLIPQLPAPSLAGIQF